MQKPLIFFFLLPKKKNDSLNADNTLEILMSCSLTMSFNNWAQESIFFPGQGKIREFMVGQGNFLDRT